MQDAKDGLGQERGKTTGVELKEGKIHNIMCDLGGCGKELLENGAGPEKSSFLKTYKISLFLSGFLLYFTQWRYRISGP